MEQELRTKNTLSTFWNKLLGKNITFREIIFIILALSCLSTLVSPAVALLLGFCVAQFVGHPYLHLNNKIVHLLLQASVVGLGFGMNVESAWIAGKSGFIFALASILATLSLGIILGYFLKVEKKTSYLITTGTAICGGSAIAAISPVIKAKEHQASISLGVIFILNAVALFVFPSIGHAFDLSQTQFGLWCAIAIHDTSSVIGAANKYGNQALEVATTVKLARALWIIPLTIVSLYLFKSDKSKIKFPYFIALFILAMMANTYFTVIHQITPYLVNVSKVGMTLSLFLIGCGLSINKLKHIGIRPMLQGVILWCTISAMALAAIIAMV